MKILQKNQMNSVYGGREVVSTGTVATENGSCYTDKLITRNNGSIKVVMKHCD